MAFDTFFNRFRFFSFDRKRDYNNTFDHPEGDPTAEDLMKVYKRGDISQTIIKTIPKACWNGCKPYVRETRNYKVETPFEKAFTELSTRIPIFAELERADIISGIGRYGGLFLGFDDGRDLMKPVRTGSNLLYVRPLSEVTLTVATLEQNPASPRFGMPVLYGGMFLDDKLGTSAHNIHWERILHITDNRIESNIYGEPRLTPVLNRVLDLHKVLGVSAETFWLGAFGGIAFEADADTTIEDPEGLTEEIEKYVAGLQRYLKLQGIKSKTLNVDIKDPTAHVEAQLQMISAQTGIPVSIIMGSGRGELSAGKDFALLNDRVQGRRMDYVEPYILLPFIQHLINLKALPQPKEINISWLASTEALRKEQMDSGRILTDAIRMYLESGAFELIPPANFLEDVLKIGAEKVEEYSPASVEDLRKVVEQKQRRKGEIDDSSFKKIGGEEKKISKE